MVKRAARVCPTLGCINLVSGSSRYCAACMRKKQKASNRQRSSETRARYGKEWQKIRAEHLVMFPYCVDCGVLGSQVDHLVPLSQGGTNDHSNLKTRCHSCHSSKTASSDGGFGNPVKKRG